MRARPVLALAEVAADIGYRSEAAFNVAFRRESAYRPEPGAHSNRARMLESLDVEQPWLPSASRARVIHRFIGE